MSKKFFVVLSPNGKEGFITSDEDDASYAATGISGGGAVSTLADHFREIYFEESDDEDDVAQDFDEAEVITVEMDIP